MSAYASRSSCFPNQLNGFDRVEKIDFSTNAQKDPQFLAVNPNGRMYVCIPGIYIPMRIVLH
jgi:hypothetical protein